MSEQPDRPPLLDIRDWHVYGGLLLTGAGAAAAWWPAGLMVVGVGALALGLFIRPGSSKD